MEERTVHIPNITCEHCVNTIRLEAGEIEGVKAVEGDAEKKSVTFRWEPPADWEKIAKLLTEIGYPPKGQ